MNKAKLFCTTALMIVFGTFGAYTFAADSIDPDEFVDEASAKGMAEIKTSKMALEKSQSADVREFAQRMITDHNAANNELASIAKRKKLDVADDTELMSKAKAMVLKQRDGESFDQAYANNQVNAHEQTIDLFEQAVNIKDPELKAFAQRTLPKLRSHLEMARELVESTGANSDNETDAGTGAGARGTGSMGTGTMGTGTGGRDVDNDTSVRNKSGQVD